MSTTTNATMTAQEMKLITLLSHPRMGELKDSKGLNARLAGCGFVETCGRCLGSGRYSFNLMDGDKCYGCGGSGTKVRKINRELVKDVTEFVSAGKLEEYVSECIRKGERKRIALGAQKRITAAERGMRWRAYWYPAEKNGMGLGTEYFSFLAYAIHDWASKAENIGLHLSLDAQNSHKVADREHAINLLAELADGLVQTIELIDQVWDVLYASGAVDADRLEMVAVGLGAHRESGEAGYWAERAYHIRVNTRAEEMVMGKLQNAGVDARIIEALMNMEDTYNFKKGYKMN